MPEGCGFRPELEQLLNRHSMESGSNTPDFILAEFLHRCLTAFDATTNARDVWCGRQKLIAVRQELSATQPEKPAAVLPSIQPGVDGQTAPDWQDHLADAAYHCRCALDHMRPVNGRRAALAKTKLEEASHWMRDIREVGP